MNPAFENIFGKSGAAVIGRPLAILLTALLPSALHGQSMDYGALERLFREPVTTSVAGSPQRVSDVPATMEIITAEDIRRSGAKDIPGVLRHVGGVDTLEWGNDNIDVSVRGYNQALSARLLVLVDGRQVYTDDYGYTPWSSVPVELDMIRQIEIIKGPNSALFGFNAAGGVINIITYSPLYDNVNAISSTDGTQGMAGGSVVATHKFGKDVAVRLSMGGDSNTDFSTSIPAGMEVTPRERQYHARININSVIRFNDRMQLGLEATHSVAQLNEIEPSYQLYSDEHGTDSVRVQLTADNRLGLLQASVYTNWTRVTAGSGAANPPIILNDRITVAEAHDIFKPGIHHTLRLAAEYRFKTEGTTPITGGRVDEDVWAVSGMWNWTVTPSISLINAVRVDRQSLEREGAVPFGYPFINADWNRSYIQPSYNSGLVWKPTEVDSLRLAAGRGTQLPSLVESGSLVLITPFYSSTGSPFLNPTNIDSYEVGWDHTLPRPHIVFRVSAFHQRSENLQAISGGVAITAIGLYSLPSNIGSSNANGLEFGLRSSRLNNYRWSVDYRPEWIADHFLPFAQNGAAFTDYQHTTPHNLLKASLGWTNSKWEMDGYFHYQSGTLGIQFSGLAGALTPVGGFASLDTRVAYNLTNRMTWSISGQNLTLASQLQTAGPAIERRVLGTMSMHF